ncbi:hypothetical protein EVAR_4327_1 [Eumeta japonica]|uniref:Reverse transcriptase domain-containing protein n=1 Tax=Eumeta variegata TaxID=151549 RepID=A0A4C1VC37_EUMVA|nr:hypothetical protein EVAR_4327_1 [Eumeta japonica]
MDELSVKFLLCADDQVILTLSACGLQEMINKMILLKSFYLSSLINNSVKKKGMKLNISKTKVMIFERGESTTECNILKEDEKVEQVKEFVYLGSLFTNDGKRDRDIERRVNAGNEVNTRYYG